MSRKKGKADGIPERLFVEPHYEEPGICGFWSSLKDAIDGNCRAIICEYQLVAKHRIETKTVTLVDGKEIK